MLLSCIALVRNRRKYTIHKFFEKNDLRLIKLCSLLLESEAESMTIYNASKLIGVDPRVVFNLINQYKEPISSVVGIQISIINNKIIYKFSETFSLDNLKKVLLQNSVLFILCRDIFIGEFSNIVDFSNKYFISVASMYRKIPVLKKILKEYNIKIELANASILIANEKQIRDFYHELFYYAYGLIDAYKLFDFAGIDLEEGYIKIKKSKQSKIVQTKINLLMAISQVRIKNKHFITEETLELNYVDQALITNEIINYFSGKLLSINKNFSDHIFKNEIDFFTGYILTMDITYIDEDQKINLKSKDIDYDITYQIKKWLKNFTLFLKQYNLESNTPFMINNLYRYFYREKLLQRDLVQKSSKIINETYLAKNNEYVYKKTKEFLKHMESSIDKSIKFEFVYDIFNEIINSNKYAINCCVISTNYLFKKKIEDGIRTYALVPVKFTDNITEITELIISDTYFENEKKILFVKPVPSSREYSRISEVILTIYDRLWFS